MSEQEPYQYQAWPAWRYGPNGEAQIFESEEDVPEGWGSFPPGTEPEPEESDVKPLRLTAAEKRAAKEAAEKAAAEAAEAEAAAKSDGPVTEGDF